MGRVWGRNRAFGRLTVIVCANPIQSMDNYINLLRKF